MTAYLAQITVRDTFDDDERAGMADALGAHERRVEGDGAAIFGVRGEAPDLAAAVSAAHQHAAEVLDGYAFEVDVTELP